MKKIEKGITQLKEPRTHQTNQSVDLKIVMLLYGFLKQVIKQATEVSLTSVVRLPWSLTAWSPIQSIVAWANRQGKV